MPGMSPRWVIGTAVVLAHGLCLGSLASPRERAPEPSELTMSAVIIRESMDPRSTDTTVLPALRLVTPSIGIGSLVDVRFDDPDADLVPGVTAEVSAPHPSTSQDTSAASFALRAALQPGTSVTVILSVEVLPDGSAGQVSVVAGSGNALVDAQATAYVRALRWIPGSVHRHATIMRIQFPVTLSIDSQ